MGQQFRRRRHQEQAPEWIPLRTGFRYVQRQELEDFEFDAATAKQLDGALNEIDRYHRSVEARVNDLPLC